MQCFLFSPPSWHRRPLPRRPVGAPASDVHGKGRVALALSSVVPHGRSAGKVSTKRHRCKMTPNSTNAGRTIESIAFRVAVNGARNRNLRAESSRNQVLLLILVHKNAMLRATPVGASRRGHQHGPESGQGATNVQQKHYRAPPIANAVVGTCRNVYFWTKLGSET
jgi:hypothetical protein